MKVAKRTTVALCPDCEEEIDLGPKPKERQKVVCPNCEAYLEVISLEPLELSWDNSEFDEEWADDEDWEDDDDWDADDDWDRDEDW